VVLERPPYVQAVIRWIDHAMCEAILKLAARAALMQAIATLKKIVRQG
jgi:hypothetical protein